MYKRWDPREPQPKIKRQNTKTSGKKPLRRKVVKKTFKQLMREGRKFIFGDFKRIYTAKYYKREKFFLFKQSGAYTYYFTREKFRRFLKTDRKYLRRFVRKRSSPYKRRRKQAIRKFAKNKRKKYRIRKLPSLKTKTLLPINIPKLKITGLARIQWRNYGYKRVRKKKKLKALRINALKRLKRNHVIRNTKRIIKSAANNEYYDSTPNSSKFIINTLLSKQKLIKYVKKWKFDFKFVSFLKKNASGKLVKRWKRVILLPKTEKKLMYLGSKHTPSKKYILALLYNVKSKLKQFYREEKIKLHQLPYPTTPKSKIFFQILPQKPIVYNKQYRNNALRQIHHVTNNFLSGLKRITHKINKNKIKKHNANNRIVDMAKKLKLTPFHHKDLFYRKLAITGTVIDTDIIEFIDMDDDMVDKTTNLVEQLRLLNTRNKTKIFEDHIKKSDKSRKPQKRKILKRSKRIFNRFLQYIRTRNNKYKLLFKLRSKFMTKCRKRFIDKLLEPLLLVPFAMSCKMEVGEKIVINNQNQTMKYYLMGIRNNFAVYNLTFIMFGLRLTLMSMVARMLVKVRTIINYAGNTNLSNISYKPLEEFPRNQFLITWRKWTGGILTNFKRISKRIISRIHNTRRDSRNNQINVHYPKNIPKFPGYMLNTTNHHWALNESKNVRLKNTQLVEISHLGDFGDINLPFNTTYFSLRALTALLQETASYVKTLKKLSHKKRIR